MLPDAAYATGSWVFHALRKRWLASLAATVHPDSNTPLPPPGSDGTQAGGVWVFNALRKCWMLRSATVHPDVYYFTFRLLPLVFPRSLLLRTTAHTYFQGPVQATTVTPRVQKGATPEVRPPCGR